MAKDDIASSIEQLIQALEEKGAADGDRRMYLRALLRQVESKLTAVVALIARIRKAV